jgi:hypothetical protein
MTQSRHTPLGIRTQLVAVAGALHEAQPSDYFSNERSTQQLGTIKAQLERDGFKDVAQQAAVALRIAELLQDGGEINSEQALELQRMLVDSMASALGVELPASSSPAAARAGEATSAASKLAATSGGPSLRMVSNRKLGEILVQMSLLTSAQVEQALAHQRMTGCRLGEALIQMRLLPKATVESALRVQGARRIDSGDPWRAVS